MANHQIPRAAERIERAHGIDDDGNVVTLAVYRHTRAGHELPDYYVVQYRELNRAIDRASRVTLQFTGPRAAERLEADLAGARAMLAESREREAERAADECDVSFWDVTPDDWTAE
jgi:hypothetical protein